MQAILEVIEQEEKAEQQKWMIGLHVQAFSVYAGLLDHKGLPSTRAEQKSAEKITDAEIERDREPTARFLAEFRKAVSSPQRFGVLVGMPDILGEPPPETVETAEQLKQRLRERDREAKQGFMAAMEGLAKRP